MMPYSAKSKPIFWWRTRLRFKSALPGPLGGVIAKHTVQPFDVHGSIIFSTVCSQLQAVIV